jgi:hypothetical protein
VIALLGVGSVMLSDPTLTQQNRQAATLSPPSVPIAPTTPIAAREARTLTLHSGTERADGTRTKATSAAMLHLLTALLPPGRTSHFSVSADDDLRVQLYLDDGQGPGLIQVAVTKTAGDSTAAQVTISHNPGDCLAATTIDAAWPDGTLVEVDVPTCLAPGGAEGEPALTLDEAVRVAADPRWGVTMDPGLVAAGAKRFPSVPVLAG